MTIECKRVVNTDGAYLLRFDVRFRNCARFVTQTLASCESVEIVSSKLPHPESTFVEMLVKIGPLSTTPILAIIRDSVDGCLHVIDNLLKEVSWSVDPDRLGRVGDKRERH